MIHNSSVKRDEAATMRHDSFGSLRLRGRRHFAQRLGQIAADDSQCPTLGRHQCVTTSSADRLADYGAARLRNTAIASADRPEGLQADPYPVGHLETLDIEQNPIVSLQARVLRIGRHTCRLEQNTQVGRYDAWYLALR